MNAAINRLAVMPKPLINLVDGPVAGAGLGLALLGDVVIAAENAHFTSAYTAIGAIPDAGTSWLLPRLVGLRTAQELICTV
jgi:2-(1,2-epoxy-1,2-dihydrophenyl)acetyl-CoA isomerase